MTSRSSVCQGCEIIPPAQDGSTVLYLAPPVEHVFGVLRDVARQCGVPADEPAPGIIALHLPDPRHVRDVGDVLGKSVSRPELDQTRALMHPGESLPGLADIVRADSLAHVLSRIEGSWLPALLAEHRLTTYFQPLVSSADHSETVGYECLTRGLETDGTLIPAARLFQVAVDTDMLFHLDRAARLGAIHAAARHSLTGLVFINFRPSAIYNPRFCLRSTVQAASEAGIAPERIVFEVVENEEIHDIDHLLDIFRVYRAAGFRVAVDDLGSGYGSLSLVHRLDPDFVKLDRELVDGVAADPAKAILVGKVLEAIAELDVISIAEGVERREDAEWLTAHGADLLQGYLFGRPSADPAPSVGPSGP